MYFLYIYYCIYYIFFNILKESRDIDFYKKL